MHGSNQRRGRCRSIVRTTKALRTWTQQHSLMSKTASACSAEVPANNHAHTRMHQDTIVCTVVATAAEEHSCTKPGRLPPQPQARHGVATCDFLCLPATAVHFQHLWHACHQDRQRSCLDPLHTMTYAMPVYAPSLADTCAEGTRCRRLQVLRQGAVIPSQEDATVLVWEPFFKETAADSCCTHKEHS